MTVKRLVEKLRARRTRRDDGASAVEYGLLVALIAVVIAGTVFILGQALNDQFKGTCEAVQQNTSATNCDGNSGSAG
jgi:pilus assembly protein Flp/PilA